jgi:hypothetical protein
MNFEFKRKNPVKSVEKVVGEKQKAKRGFRHGAYVLFIRGQQKGNEGYVKEYIPGMLEVIFEDNTKGFLKQQQFRYTEERDIVVIVKGARKGMKARVVQKIPARLNLMVFNRPVNGVLVDDIFYKDLVLKTGEPVQVMEITEDNTIRVYSLRGGKMMDIKRSDIAYEERGFSFSQDIFCKILQNNSVVSFSMPSGTTIEMLKNEIKMKYSSSLSEIKRMRLDILDQKNEIIAENVKIDSLLGDSFSNQKNPLLIKFKTEVNLKIDSEVQEQEADVDIPEFVGEPEFEDTANQADTEDDIPDITDYQEEIDDVQQEDNLQFDEAGEISTGQEFQEEDQYKNSFKDTQRTVQVIENMNATQKTVKSNIDKIMKAISLNEDIIDLYDTIADIEGIINKVQEMVPITITESLEVVFIIVCGLYYQLMKSYEFTLTFDEYINKLISKRVLRYNDLLVSSNSIILGLMPSVQVTGSNEEKLMIIINAWNQYLSGIMRIEVRRAVKVYEPEFIPLGRSKNLPSQMRTVYSGKTKSGVEFTYGQGGRPSETVSVYELLANQIPETEAEIEWQSCEDLLEKYRIELKKKLESTPVNARKSRAILQFTIDNLHRAPYVLGRGKMDKPTGEFFQNMYNQMIKKCSVRLMKELEKRNPGKSGEVLLRDKIERLRVSRQRSEEMREQREVSNQQRKALMTEREYDRPMPMKFESSIMNKLAKDAVKNNAVSYDDDDVEIKDTPAFIREGKKRELKNMIISRTNKMNLDNYRQKKKAEKEAKAAKENNEGEKSEDSMEVDGTDDNVESDIMDMLNVYENAKRKRDSVPEITKKLSKTKLDDNDE